MTLLPNGLLDLDIIFLFTIHIKGLFDKAERIAGPVSFEIINFDFFAKLNKIFGGDLSKKFRALLHFSKIGSAEFLSCFVPATTIVIRFFSK